MGGDVLAEASIGYAVASGGKYIPTTFKNSLEFSEKNTGALMNEG